MYSTFGEDGTLKVTTGRAFTDGLSALGTGDIASNTQLIVGGEKMNVDTSRKEIM